MKYKLWSSTNVDVPEPNHIETDKITRERMCVCVCVLLRNGHRLSKDTEKENVP